MSILDFLNQSSSQEQASSSNNAAALSMSKIQHKLANSRDKTATQPASPSTTPTRQMNGVTVYDVLCGRDKQAFNNIGNRRMRVLVALSLPRYLEETSRRGKSQIIKEVAESIQECGGRFLKWDASTGTYQELNEKKVHEKCSHAFRDMVSARMATSSNNANNKTKKTKKSKANTCPRSLVPFECKSVVRQMSRSNEQQHQQQHGEDSSVVSSMTQDEEEAATGAPMENTIAASKALLYQQQQSTAMIEPISYNPAGNNLMNEQFHSESEDDADNNGEEECDWSLCLELLSDGDSSLSSSTSSLASVFD